MKNDARLGLVRDTAVKAGYSDTDPVGLLGVLIDPRDVRVKSQTPTQTIVEVVATTDDVDLDDEVVVPGGANLAYFLRNGSVFVDHDTRFASRVGVQRSVRPFPTGSSQRGWAVDIVMDPGAFAQDVLAKAQSGGMGMSIGFRAKDWGKPTAEEVKRYTRDGKAPQSIVRTWDWLELSFTPMPCNVACRVVSVMEPEAEEEPSPKAAWRTLVHTKRMPFVRVLTAQAKPA